MKSLLILAFLQNCASVLAIESNNAPPSYSITQNSREASRVIVYATKNAIKIRCLKNHLVTVAKAPDWTVSTYSEESKRICTIPLSRYANGFRMALAITGEPAFSPNDFSKIRNDKLNNQSVDWYQSTKAFADKTYQIYVKEEVTGDYPRIVQYALANALGLPKQVGLVLQRFYGCPQEDGIPLLMKYDGCVGTNITKLSTEQVTSKTFPEAEFDIPKAGYTKVASIIEVVADRKKSVDADELMNTFSKFAQ